MTHRSPLATARAVQEAASVTEGEVISPTKAVTDLAAFVLAVEAMVVAGQQFVDASEPGHARAIARGWVTDLRRLLDGPDHRPAHPAPGVYSPEQGADRG